MTYQPPEENFPYDPAGIEAMDKWGRDHPWAFRTIQVATLIAFLWLIGLFAHVLQTVAYVVALAWVAFLLVVHRRDFAARLFEQALANTRRFWSWAVAAALGKLFLWRNREARSLSLKAESGSVAHALSLDTPEADIMLARTRPELIRQLDTLRAKERRDYHDELDIRRISQMIQDIDAKQFGPTLVQRPMSELGAVGRPQGFFGAVAGSKLWIAAGAAFLGLLALLGFQTARLEHAKADVREARADLAMSERNLAAARETATALAENARQAAAQSRQTAETIETERALRARSDRERRRIQDALEQARAGAPIDYGFGGVRDAGDQSGAGRGDDAAAPGAG